MTTPRAFKGKAIYRQEQAIPSITKKMMKLIIVFLIKIDSKGLVTGMLATSLQNFIALVFG